MLNAMVWFHLYVVICNEVFDSLAVLEVQHSPDRSANVDSTSLVRDARHKKGMKVDAKYKAKVSEHLVAAMPKVTLDAKQQKETSVDAIASAEVSDHDSSRKFVRDAKRQGKMEVYANGRIEISDYDSMRQFVRDAKQRKNMEVNAKGDVEISPNHVDSTSLVRDARPRRGMDFDANGNAMISEHLVDSMPKVSTSYVRDAKQQKRTDIDVNGNFEIFDNDSMRKPSPSVVRGAKQQRRMAVVNGGVSSATKEVQLKVKEAVQRKRNIKMSQTNVSRNLLQAASARLREVHGRQVPTAPLLGATVTTSAPLVLETTMASPVLSTTTEALAPARGWINVFIFMFFLVPFWILSLWLSYRAGRMQTPSEPRSPSGSERSAIQVPFLDQPICIVPPTPSFATSNEYRSQVARDLSVKHLKVKEEPLTEDAGDSGKCFPAARAGAARNVSNSEDTDSVSSGPPPDADPVLRRDRSRHLDRTYARAKRG